MSERDSQQPRHRAADLARRRAELAAGQIPTEETAEVARQRAAESLDRARAAHESAARRHDEAALKHEQAATTHEMAARVDADEGARHRVEAEKHMHAAELDHQRALDAQSQADFPETSSSGSEYDPDR